MPLITHGTESYIGIETPTFQGLRVKSCAVPRNAGVAPHAMDLEWLALFLLQTQTVAFGVLLLRAEILVTRRAFRKPLSSPGAERREERKMYSLSLIQRRAAVNKAEPFNEVHAVRFLLYRTEHLYMHLLETCLVPCHSFAPVSLALSSQSFCSVGGSKAWGA